VIELYIGSGAGGWAVDGTTRGWAAHEDVAAALARWTADIARAHATRWRRAPVALWLSGGLARPLLCGPVDGLRGWREAEAFAAAAAPEATGLAGPCIVAFEDWPETAPAFATAIEQALADTIAGLAREHRIAWRSVRPWWAAALQAALRERPSVRVLAVAEDDALTLLGGPPPQSGLASRAQAAFDYATTYAPAPDDAQATALWHRTLLSHDILADDARFVRTAPAAAAAAGGWPAPAWGLDGGAA